MSVKREKVSFEFQALNWNFLKLLAEIAAYAHEKYGEVEQYADGRLEGNQSPINHAYEHLRQYANREKHDKFGTLEHQLAAVAYNAMMEYYYLTNGGPTVTSKLYVKTPSMSDPQLRLNFD